MIIRIIILILLLVSYVCVFIDNRRYTKKYYDLKKSYDKLLRESLRIEEEEIRSDDVVYEEISTEPFEFEDKKNDSDNA